jgi:hypothetical protein
VREEALLSAKIPSASITAIEGVTQVLSGRADFKLAKDSNDGSWHLCATVQTEFGEQYVTELLLSEDIQDVLQDALLIDQYLQDEEFKKHMEDAVESAVRIQLEERGRSCNLLNVVVCPDPYVLQQHVTEGRTDLLKILGRQVRRKAEKADMPSHLQVRSPKNFLPDEVMLESLLQRIYEGVPAIAILGPTGSGKSSLARYVMANLHRLGYAGYIIDANARLEGDRLFDRDDFNTEGTFILEGVLCRIARETREQGLRLLVLLEEYNSLTDDTRREFYRLFSDEDRFYAIQSNKDGKLLDTVDFLHVQFILTGNPLSSENYLTDDLKRLSNAETRRLVILYQGYATSDNEIRKILKAIVTKKPSFQQLKKAVQNLESQVNWNIGVSLFKALNKQGDGLGWDVGYSQVADAIWTAALRGKRQDAFVIAVTEHVLNGIPDLGIRQVAAQRIRQEANIVIPEAMIMRNV